MNRRQQLRFARAVFAFQAFDEAALDTDAYYGRDPESARYFKNLVNKFEVPSTDDDGYSQRYFTLDDVQPLKEKRVSFRRPVE